VSPFQQLVKFTKISTLFAAALTILCAVMLFGITSWIQNGVWNAYPVSLVISSLQADRNGPYVTASVKKVETGSPIKEISDWLLEIPAIVPLLIMSALLLAFYLKLSAIQKAARN
jgi:hypothetical protein